MGHQEADCYKKKNEEEKANSAIEGDVALMAHAPELAEDESEKDWKEEANRMMSMNGWGDDDDDDSTYHSMPMLIQRDEDD